MTNVDVRALAKLARLEVTDEEVATLEREIPEILDFVETLQKVEVPKEEKGTGLRNVMRDDVSPHEGGLHTEKLLAAAPKSKDGRLVVKQVISRKK